VPSAFPWWADKMCDVAASESDDRLGRREPGDRHYKTGARTGRAPRPGSVSSAAAGARTRETSGRSGRTTSAGNTARGQVAVQGCTESGNYGLPGSNRAVPSRIFVRPRAAGADVSAYTRSNPTHFGGRSRPVSGLSGCEERTGEDVFETQTSARSAVIRGIESGAQAGTGWPGFLLLKTTTPPVQD
jgi:hypothetical protein